MAWRIADSVIRGELDNRVKGTVTGRIWLNGVTEPVELRLKGNALADLAGCLIKFENIEPTIPLGPETRLHDLQEGTTGDLTVSRKVRVPDVPFEELYALRKAGKPAPEHLANCLYLEWFSEANGRVVIEGIDWRTEISAAGWHLSAADEEQRARDAADGFAGFMNKLSAAIESKRTPVTEDKEWDEFDFERLMKESDAHTDKLGEPDETEEKLAEETGWNQRRGDIVSGGDKNDLFGTAERNRIAGIDVDPPAPDPLTEGIDWIRVREGRAEEIRHPLQHRCFESAMRLWREYDELERRTGAKSDPDVLNLTMEFQITSAKLAGALNGLAYGRETLDAGFIVAALKRALSHLLRAQAALEKVAVKDVFPAASIARDRRELFEIHEEIVRLMGEFGSGE